VFWRESTIGGVVGEALGEKVLVSVGVFARVFTESIDATLAAFVQGVVLTRLFSGVERLVPC
jgi:microcompartment protein CcmK/EutM